MQDHKREGVTSTVGAGNLGSASNGGNKWVLWSFQRLVFRKVKWILHLTSSLKRVVREERCMRPRGKRDDLTWGGGSLGGKSSGIDEVVWTCPEKSAGCELFGGATGGTQGNFVTS